MFHRSRLLDNNLPHVGRAVAIEMDKFTPKTFYICEPTFSLKGFEKMFLLFLVLVI